MSYARRSTSAEAEFACGEEERESERRPAAAPAARADHARSNAPGLPSLDGPVVGEPARLLPLLLDEREGLPDVEGSVGLADLGGEGVDEVRLGGSQMGLSAGVTGIVMRA